MSNAYSHGLHANKQKPVRAQHAFVCNTAAEAVCWTRRLHEAIFGITTTQQDEDNILEALKNGGSGIAALQHHEYPWLNNGANRRHALVFINPFSGTKKAKKLFDSLAFPIFRVSHLKFDVVLTERAGHAREICQQIDLGKYTEVHTCGGDGIVSEVIQGLMTHKQSWKKAIKLPIGVLPGGTGNGLASSLLGKTIDVAAFHIARGFFAPLDLASCLQRPSKEEVDETGKTTKRMFSFLSVSFGFIADVDLGTEDLRFLGGLRNELGALRGILKLKSYDATIRFVDEKIPKPDHLPLDSKNPAHAVHKILNAEQMASTYAASSLDDEQDEVSNSDAEDGLHIACPLLQRFFPETNEFFDHGKAAVPHPTSASASTSTAEGTRYELREIKDRFVNIIASNCTHIAYNVIISPYARTDSGYMDLLLIRKTKNVGRLKIVSMFAGLDKGQHVAHPELEQIRTRAFQIVPNTPGSYMVVDGELVKYDSIWIEVHPGLARAFVEHDPYLTRSNASSQDVNQGLQIASQQVVDRQGQPTAEEQGVPSTEQSSPLDLTQPDQMQSSDQQFIIS